MWLSQNLFESGKMVVKSKEITKKANTDTRTIAIGFYYI